MTPRPKLRLAALAALLAALAAFGPAGCASARTKALDELFGPTGGEDAGHYVRTHRGRGSSAVLDAPYEDVYAAALGYFRSSAYHTVEPTLGAVFADDYHGLFSAAVFLSPGPKPGQTVAEVLYYQDHEEFMSSGQARAVERSLLDGIVLAVPRKTAAAQPAPAAEADASMDEMRTPMVLCDADQIDGRAPGGCPDDAALVVGVTRYRRVHQADFAAHDASTFARYARDRFGIPESNIKLLVNENATADDIRQALADLRARPHRQVIVFFAGHGAADPVSGAAALLPWNAEESRPAASGVPLGELLQALAAVPARKRVVFLDSCFSGHGGRSTAARGLRPLTTVREPAPDDGTTIMTASGPDQVAGADPSVGHGLFTYYLLLGLNRYPAARGIRLGCLYEYLKPRVAEHSRRLGWEQTPRLFGESEPADAQGCP